MFLCYSLWITILMHSHVAICATQLIPCKWHTLTHTNWHFQMYISSASFEPVTHRQASSLPSLSLLHHSLFTSITDSAIIAKPKYTEGNSEKPQTYVLDVTCQFRTSFNRLLNCCSLSFSSFLLFSQPSKRHSLFSFFKIVTIFVCTFFLFPLSLSAFSFFIFYLFTIFVYFLMPFHYRFKTFFQSWLGLFCFGTSCCLPFQVIVTHFNAQTSFSLKAPVPGSESKVAFIITNMFVKSCKMNQFQLKRSEANL